jgi:hypothetical protein
VIIRLVMAFAMAVSINSGTVARTYTNSTFGLQVELPAGKTVCTSEDGESDRGFTVLWETKKCPPADDATGIYVYVEYNALGWRSTLDEGRSICSGAAIKPSSFTVSGFRFYHCKSRTDRGKASLAYFVLRNTDLRSPDNAVGYGVTLICPHDNCRKLMPMTDWLFMHMKFVKQQ